MGEPLVKHFMESTQTQKCEDDRHNKLQIVSALLLFLDHHTEGKAGLEDVTLVF
jgi:hypothetical protein